MSLGLSPWGNECIGEVGKLWLEEIYVSAALCQVWFSIRTSIGTLDYTAVM